MIPLGTTDLAGQFHLIAHVVVSTENEVVYRSCWRSMVQMAAEYLTKEHATLLPLEDDNDASELPVLETLSRAQYYMTLYQDMLKETPSTPEERESVEEADEEAASHFQARCEQDEELQNREHVVKTTNSRRSLGRIRNTTVDTATRRSTMHLERNRSAACRMGQVSLARLRRGYSPTTISRR